MTVTKISCLPLVDENLKNFVYEKIGNTVSTEKKRLDDSFLFDIMVEIDISSM